MTYSTENEEAIRRNNHELGRRLADRIRNRMKIKEPVTTEAKLRARIIDAIWLLDRQAVADAKRILIEALQD